MLPSAITSLLKECLALFVACTGQYCIACAPEFTLPFVAFNYHLPPSAIRTPFDYSSISRALPRGVVLFEVLSVRARGRSLMCCCPGGLPYPDYSNRLITLGLEPVELSLFFINLGMTVITTHYSDLSLIPKFVSQISTSGLPTAYFLVRHRARGSSSSHFQPDREFRKDLHLGLSISLVAFHIFWTAMDFLSDGTALARLLDRHVY